MTSPDERWTLRVKDMQERLSLGRNTLYDLCRRNLIPHKRVAGKRDEATGEIIGGMILFSEKSVRAWLESNDDDGGQQWQ